MSSNGEKTEKFQKNLEAFNSTIAKLVSGETNVVSDEERQSITSPDMMDAARKAFVKTIEQADQAITRVLGDERIWITRGISIVICISELEKHPEIAKFTNSDGVIEVNKEKLCDLHPHLVEAILNIQSALVLFLNEDDGPGKTIALKALASSGHGIEFYGEGYIGAQGIISNFYARIQTKWGYIRAQKPK